MPSPRHQYPSLPPPALQADSIADLYDAIAEAHVEYPDYVQPSQDCMDLMRALLQPDPVKRATSAEVNIISCISCLTQQLACRVAAGGRAGGLGLMLAWVPAGVQRLAGSRC